MEKIKAFGELTFGVVVGLLSVVVVLGCLGLIIQYNLPRLLESGESLLKTIVYMLPQPEEELEAVEVTKVETKDGINEITYEIDEKKVREFYDISDDSAFLFIPPPDSGIESKETIPQVLKRAEKKEEEEADNILETLQGY